MFSITSFKYSVHVTVVFVSFVILVSCKPSNEIQLQVPVEHSWSEYKIVLLQQFLLPTNNKIDDQTNAVSDNRLAASLGKEIFFNKNFSTNKSVACASCHQPDKYFTDGLKSAKGIELTSRNTPTIVGVAQSQWFFHDGKADTLWSQALGPLENKKEHGSNRSYYAQVIFNNETLKSAYERVFKVMPDISDVKRFPLNAGPVEDINASKAWEAMDASDQKTITDIFVNIGKSIAAYEQYLQPSRSRVDDYIDKLSSGKTSELDSTLSVNEANGMRLFIGKANCIICHFGSSFTDSEFHNVATVDINNKPYDWGRYNGVKQLLSSEFNCRSQYNDAKDDKCEELKYTSSDAHETMASFKTPGLRNVSKTAPYMHDGQFNDLASVLAHYANPDKLILGKKDLLPTTLSKQNQSDLVAFLKALDSKLRPLPVWLN